MSSSSALFVKVMMLLDVPCEFNSIINSLILINNLIFYDTKNHRLYQQSHLLSSSFLSIKKKKNSSPTVLTFIRFIVFGRLN